MLLPSIAFQGNCDEAISYYKEILGAEVAAINYVKDAPSDSGLDDLPPNFVTYSEVLMFGTRMVMTDGTNEEMSGETFWFTLTFDTTEEVVSIFNKLADGGEITEALAPQFWASLNGSVVDRFGVHWNIVTSN
ncbi:MAG: VOC family protein [Defluviitaleaceae bacterium]|nr:VOC family protein [Defluviitaleaceae bacterium]